MQVMYSVPMDTLVPLDIYVDAAKELTNFSLSAVRMQSTSYYTLLTRIVRPPAGYAVEGILTSVAKLVVKQDNKETLCVYRHHYTKNQPTIGNDILLASITFGYDAFVYTRIRRTAIEINWFTKITDILERRKYAIDSQTLRYHLRRYMRQLNARPLNKKSLYTVLATSDNTIKIRQLERFITAINTAEHVNVHFSIW